MIIINFSRVLLELNTQKTDLATAFHVLGCILISNKNELKVDEEQLNSLLISYGMSQNQIDHLIPCMAMTDHKNQTASS